MPEWTSLGTIIPAQHIINITSSPNYNPHYTPSSFHLLGCEFPTWICSNPLPQQIQDSIAYNIASHLGDSDSFTQLEQNYRLFSEDPIQKIRTLHYYGEVPFLFHTKNPTSIELFTDYIQQQQYQDDDYEFFE